ncbi:MAG: hypothetical protein WCG85_01070 [Polyangia bacterium]
MTPEPSRRQNQIIRLAQTCVIVPLVYCASTSTATTDIGKAGPHCPASQAALDDANKAAKIACSELGDCEGMNSREKTACEKSHTTDCQAARQAVTTAENRLDCCMAAAAERNKTPQKTIRFTFVKDIEILRKRVPRGKKTIFFAYFDPIKVQWRWSTKKTDSRGSCSFQVPGGDRGESYAFLYGTDKGDMEYATEEAGNGKRFAWRIPPGEQQDLELLIDGQRARNTKGTIQVTSAKPAPQEPCQE